MILHLDLDSFFVSVECILNPDLKGKAVIVGGDGNRGVVSSCSYEARKFGIRSAMPSSTAKRLCPNAIFVFGGHRKYGEFSQKVTDIIAARAPKWEKASIDEFYLDLSGMERFFNPFDWSMELKKEITDKTGLPISFGLSVNKLVAKIATDEGKPNGNLFVPQEQVLEFLGKLKVGKIPFVGQKTADNLNMRGIYTINDLRALSQYQLERWYGKSGLFLWEKARGIDHGRVGREHEAKSMSKEHTFDTDTNDISYLADFVFKLSERLVFDLQTDKKTCSSLTFKIRYSNFETISRQCSFEPTSSLKVITRLTVDFFHKIYDGKRRLRLIGVKLSNLRDGETQPDLFNNVEKEKKMNKALNTLKKKYGSKKVRLARGVESRREGKE